MEFGDFGHATTIPTCNWIFCERLTCVNMRELDILLVK
jgi:hypothetical protein